MTVSSSRQLNKSDAAEPRGHLQVKLAASLGFGSLSIFLIWGGVPGVLLALQVAGVDPDAKEANLALIAAIGGVISTLSQPFWGMLSDRTRSRLGRRSPYLIAGAILTAVCLIGLATANTIAMMVLGWAGVQLFLNMAQAPLSAIVPDRVPRVVRGTVSAIIGMGLMFGVLGGQILASTFANDIARGYLLLAGFLVLVLVLFVLINPENPVTTDQLPPRGSVLTTIQALWVNPRKHPDFAWVFLARGLLMLGYFGVSGYQLYILSDHIGLGPDGVSLIPILAIVSMGTTLVSMLICGPLSDRLRRRKIFVVVSSMIMGFGLFFPFLMPTVEGMIVYAAIAGLGFGCYTAVDAALFTEVLPSDADAAKDLGIANIASSLPQIVAPIIAGATIALTGGYDGIFIVALVAAVLGALAILPVRSVR